MNQVINTGIIGFGLSGKVFHAPFIQAHPGFRLVSVVERHHQHSKDLYPGINILKSHSEMLKDDNIDLVVVATPNIYHYPMVKESLLAGKHVVVEKPFVPTIKEADELISLSGETGKKIFVFQNRRWDGDFLTIKKLIAAGKFGNIKYYEAHFDRFSPEIKSGAWRDENIPGGGILYDLGAHLIDQALCFFGMPDSINANVKAERPGGRVDDCFDLKLIYNDKTIVLKAGMMVRDPGPRFIIEGTEGNFSKYGIDPQEAALKSGIIPGTDDWGFEGAEYWGTLGSGPATPFDISRIPTENGNYMGFFDNIYDVLFKNKPQAILPEEARDVIFIIEKAFESSMKHRAIKIK